MNFMNLNICEFMVRNKRPFMHLRVLVEDSELREKYETHINNHNMKLIQNTEFPDSGFDLFTPFMADNTVGSHKLVGHRVNKLELGIKCASVLYQGGVQTNTGYYLYPRSSISKSCIRLANSVGIIDAGYRGQICAMVDVVYTDECYINAYDKLFQICAPDLCPVVAELVSDLGCATPRGDGGFGSTTLLEKVYQNDNL